jgi:hypothetical protein
MRHSLRIPYAWGKGLMDSQSEERDQIFNIWAKEVSVLFRDIYV